MHEPSAVFNKGSDRMADLRFPKKQKSNGAKSSKNSRYSAAASLRDAGF
jgi:hypothetical protein